MRSAGPGYRRPGFLILLLPGLHHASYERLRRGLFPSPREWLSPGSLGLRARSPRRCVPSRCVGIPGGGSAPRRAAIPAVLCPWVSLGRLWGDRTH